MNDYYDEDAPTKRPEDGELKPGDGMPLRGDDLNDAPATKQENDAEDELRRRAPLHYRPADFDDAPTIPCDEGGGSVLARRYHILKQLGQGGMGSVYLAEDLELDKKLFAIKMLPSVLVANEAAYRQLKGEALMAMKLVHTNIVQIRAFEENGGNPFIVMDYIEGKTLSACLAEWGKLSAEETAILLKPVAAAIDYAHSQKVVHRDIKPGNVLIRNDGVPFVLDFGIAREIRETMTRVTGRSSGGTLLYMSPEQLHGRAPKPAQDVYSFAAMAYECMKGEPPFVRGQVEYQIDNDSPEPLPEGTPIAAGVMAGLAKKPEDRPASCMAVIEGNGFGRAEHVEGVPGTGDGGQPAAQQPPADEIYVKPVKPKTGLLLAGAAALAVAVLGGWYGWRKHDEGQRRRAEEARRAYDEKVAKLESEKRLSDSAKAAAEAERAKLAAEKEKADARIKQLAAEQEKRELAKAKAAGKDDSAAYAAAQEAARRFAEELMQLQTDITIKKADAEAKMRSVEAFDSDPDGFAGRIKSAKAQWRKFQELPSIESIEGARQAFKIADEAEKQIGRDLNWLTKNKAGRDAARSADATIERLLAGDCAKFNAAKFAAKAYNKGLSLRKEGKSAFAKGEFAEAGRCLTEAKSRFEESGKEAKGFAVNMTLGAARRYAAAGKWQECAGETAKVLEWDAGNAEAKELKESAESHLSPSLTLIAKAGGREVRGAKITIGSQTFDSPMTWKNMERGYLLGSSADMTAEYSAGGTLYTGAFKPVDVNWPGPKTLVLELKEHKGPKQGETRTLTLPGGATMEMIYVAPGSFMMGSPESETGRFDRETQHRVTLTKGFWLGKCEVTQGQWKSEMGSNPSDFKGDDNLPVENVSWNDCQEFIRKVNAEAERQFGGEARLPTEAEWEYACRAGSTTAYSWGNALNGDKANCDGNYPCGTTEKGRYLARTCPVGSYAPNAWDFYDMHGNVWEWCSDWYGEYPGGSVTDPAGAASGGYRVLRGGSWYGNARGCRSAYRDGIDPGNRYRNDGFRLACSAGPRGQGAEQ